MPNHCEHCAELADYYRQAYHRALRRALISYLLLFVNSVMLVVLSLLGLSGLL